MVFVLVLFCLHAHAEPISSVLVEAGRDTANQPVGSAGAVLAVRKDDIVSANVSGSNNSRSFSAGYTFNNNSCINWTPGVEIWGARSDLTTKSLLTDATLNLPNWSLGLQPEIKSLIWATTSSDEGRKRKVRTNALGLHGHVEFLGLAKWLFQLRAGGFNYGGEKFDRFYYSSLITAQSMEQGRGLVKSYGSILASYHLRNLTFTSSLQRTVYLIGNFKTATYRFEIDYDFNVRWTLGAGYSRTKPDHSPGIEASSIIVGYNW